MDNRRPDDQQISADELHSTADNELEAKDQSMFKRSMVYAGIAVVLIFLAALLLVQRAGRHIRAVQPNPHPTSEVVWRATEWVG